MDVFPVKNHSVSSPLSDISVFNSVNNTNENNSNQLVLNSNANKTKTNQDKNRFFLQKVPTD